MIVVKSIEIIEAEREALELASYSPRQNAFSETIIPEMIHGRLFINANGKEFCVGMSKQVQDAIGLPMECFEDMNNQLATQQRIISQLKEMGFWKRIKFVFTGKS